MVGLVRIPMLNREKTMSIQALREQRAAEAKKLQSLVAKEVWDAERDQPVYDAGMAEIDRIDAAIKRHQEINERVAAESVTAHVADRAERAGVDAKSDGLKLYAKWLRGGDNALSAQDWQTVRATMSTTTNSEGGFTVATEVASQVLDALKEFGGVRSVANVIRTSGGNPMSFPTSDGTAEVGEIIAENASATAADPTFGTLSLPVYKFSSKIVAIPFELLQDSNVDVEAFVRGRLQTRLGRITNQMFTTGTGTSQPRGVVVAATAGVTAANSTSQVTAVTYDSLVATQHSVDPAYRRGNTAWMMNDNTLLKLRQMKDGSSRPIFVPGYEVGVPGGSPDMLLGRPIVINQDMANMAANAKAILFGDFSYYVVRDVMAVEMFRFTDSVYTSKGQVGFLAWMRTGGNLIDVGGAVKAFVNAAS
jgi:HK97 family phage major capsid protein